MSPSDSFKPFDRLALIGIGLIGSSIAMVSRKHGLAKEIAIATRRGDTLEEAKKLELGDFYTLNFADAVKGADAVILCIPVGAYGDVAKLIAPHLNENAIISDAGSVKQSAIRQVEPYLPDNVHFIPAHPVAGTEQSGPSAGFASLFVDRWCILTPDQGIDQDALTRLTEFWQLAGCRVSIMDAKHHDLVFAVTSHIPHLIAYSIVATASDIEDVTKSEIIKYSASGFRDFTRIAASDPTMWRDIFLHNQDAVLEVLARFNEDLSLLQRAIRWGDGATLFNLFRRTRGIRREIIDARQETPAPDFGRRLLGKIFNRK